MLSATSLYERGRVHSNAGRFSRARADFETALARADSYDLEARILQSLAWVQAETGDPEGGLALCQRAISLEQTSDVVRGIVNSQLGLLYLRLGHTKDALAVMDTALPLVEEMPHSLGILQMNRATALMQSGEMGRAVDALDIAARSFSTSTDEVFLARAQHNLGYARMLEGDLVEAVRLMESARPVLAPLSTVSEAIGDQDRAEVLLAAGMTQEGVAVLGAAVRAFGRRRLQQMQGEAELVLARTLVLDDPRRARRVARRANRRFTERGSTAWALRAEAVILRAEVESGGRSQALVARAHTLADSLKEAHLPDAAHTVELLAARVLVRRRETSSAIGKLGRVRKTSRTQIATRLLEREVRAELAEVRGRRAHAFTHVRQGLSELHAWQSSFGSLDLQSSLVGHGRRLAVQGMRLALDDGRPDLVFEWSERARALVSRVAPVRPPSDTRAAADLAELRHLQAQAHETDLPTTLARRESELRGRIRQRAWYDEGSREVVEPSTVEEVRAQLAADDAALAAYLVVDDRVHALVLTPDDVVVRDLGRFAPVHSLLDGMLADLDMSAASLPEMMRATVRAGLQERLDALAEHLIEPIAEPIGDHRLVITPSGALAGTPWSMLPGLVGRPVTIPRSASIWLQRRKTPLRLDSAGVVAGPRVPRAEEEVHKAASAWSRSRIVSGDDATAAAVSDLAHDADVLHVSAHGRHSADNPLFSGLELTGGPWFGYDIDQLDRIPQVVILSACELGRSTVRWGEESIGMTAAWLHAGTHCVIGSPASVADDVACEVLGETHQLMAAGVAPADALARASVRTLDPLPAPFQCFGTGW